MFSERTNWKLARNRLTEALDGARSRGEPILDLTVSNPTRVGLEYDSETILAALGSARSLDYDPQAKGLLPAREAVADYYRVDHGCDLEAERIVLTTSTSEGYSFVFRLLCNAQEEILVPKPSYPLFDFLAELQDVSLVPYSLEYAQGWLVDFHSVMRALTPRTRAILLVHPNNPTGSYLRAEEMERLNAICRERGMALIVDEVFLDYALYGGMRKSFTANRDALTFTLSGLSKISALPQMKVAWLVCTGPEALVKEAAGRLDVIADTYLSLNAPTQWAISTLFEQRHSLQRQLIERVKVNRAELRRQLAGKSGCELLESEGGWYAVLHVPADRGDEERAIELMQAKHVIVHPGHFFDFPRDGFLVVSLITPMAEFAEGVERVLDSLLATVHR